MNSVVPTYDDIIALQNALLQGPILQLETQHYFADGMYCRVLFRPKGTLIVGRVHKKEHFYIVASGSVTILGDGYKKFIKGPAVIVSQPGTKRAVLAHEDSTCLTVHRTPFTDLEEVEADIAEPAPDSPYTTGNILKPGWLTYDKEAP